jgi:hypothetical protein
MGSCKYCGMQLPANASFCEHCGKEQGEGEETLLLADAAQLGEATVMMVDEAPTSLLAMQSEHRPSEDPATIADEWQTIPAPLIESVSADQPAQPAAGPDAPAPGSFSAPPEVDDAAEPAISVEEEEPQLRKRQAVLFLPPPLPAAEAGGQVQPPPVPMVPGQPPSPPVPYVQGRQPGPGSGARAAAGSLPGYAVVTLVILLGLLLVTSGGIAAAFTIWAPTLVILNGSSTVLPGSLLRLHGAHFLPGSTVTLTLDGQIPLFFSARPAPERHLALRGGGRAAAATALAVPGRSWQTGARNALRVDGSGTFDVTITVDPAWAPGRHEIRAQEQLTPRSATLSFFILAGATPSPTASPSPGTVTTPSPTATTSPTGLTCASPATVILGPVSVGYEPPLSQSITLCASGNGSIHWTASWDSQQAPWLSLSATSGEIQAPGEQQITLNARVAGLAAGNYTATIGFTDDQGSPAQIVQVTLTMVDPCISASPNTLSFNGVALVSDPAPQNLTIASCSGLEQWSAALQLETTQDWLSLSSNSGTLAAGGSTTITVRASNVSTGLNAGTYTGKILLLSGNGLFAITVTLTVKPAPQLTLISPAAGSLQGSSDCQSVTNPSGWSCPVTIGAARTNTAPLSWTASGKGVSGITFTPASGTLAPGQTVQITVFVPANNCQATVTLSFVGPANTVTVSWSCGSNGLS